MLMFMFLPNDMGGEGKVTPQIKTKDLVVLPLFLGFYNASDSSNMSTGACGSLQK